MEILKEINKQINELKRPESSGYGQGKTKKAPEYNLKQKVKEFGKKIINSGARRTVGFTFEGTSDKWSELVNGKNEKYKIYHYTPLGSNRQKLLWRVPRNQFNQDMEKLKPVTVGGADVGGQTKTVGRADAGGQRANNLKAHEKKYLKKQANQTRKGGRAAEPSKK